MCTVTWRRLETSPTGSYQLYFNRDESRDRAAEKPPEARMIGGTRLLCPIDGESFGTWLFVNEHGLTAGIVNHYEAEAVQLKPPPLRRSRGLLLLDFAACRSVLEFSRRLVSTSLAQQYPPFLIFALAPDPPARLWIWNGEQLATGQDFEAARFLTSSSFQSTKITESRRRLYEKISVMGHDELRAFHRLALVNDPASGILMTRPDALTKSLCHISCEADKVSLSYHPRVAEQPAFGPAQRLDLPRRHIE